MKKFTVTTAEEATAIVLVGTTEEIKAVYGSIYRAWENGKTWMIPTFEEKARFSANKNTYAIMFTETETNIQFEVITSDCLCRMLLDGSLQGV